MARDRRPGHQPALVERLSTRAGAAGIERVSAAGSTLQATHLRARGQPWRRDPPPCCAWPSHVATRPVAERRLPCDVTPMLITLAVLLAVASQAEAAERFDFSRGYVVWAGSDRGRCNYFMTDVGESAKQLTETLRENYPLSAGIEILTDDDTPARCATIGVRAARKAGFTHVRIRPGTDKDRSPGIP